MNLRQTEAMVSFFYGNWDSSYKKNILLTLACKLSILFYMNREYNTSGGYREKKFYVARYPGIPSERAGY